MAGLIAYPKAVLLRLLPFWFAPIDDGSCRKLLLVVSGKPELAAKALTRLGDRYPNHRPIDVLAWPYEPLEQLEKHPNVGRLILSKHAPAMWAE